MAGVESLLERIASCDRVMVIAAANGENVPAIATRRAELTVELALQLGPVTCEDCRRRWPHEGCVFDGPFVELGWVGA